MSIAVIHQTDLFRPHEDPDDHWDLACQFALAKQGRIDLNGVLIDYPPNISYGDPDVQAVAQLSHLTGLSTQVGVGQDRQEIARECSGIRMLKRILQQAPQGVVIHIVGSCRDVARCAKREPELFREKVKAIYLNAGSGIQNDMLEYNVALDIPSYAAMFDLPCPVYWMPCFHLCANGGWEVGEYGTYYRFLQSDILNDLNPTTQNYFLDVFSRRQDGKWLKALDAPVDERLLAHYGAQYRNMWCTAGFLHTAGLTVWTDGTIAPLGEKPEREVFEFIGVDWLCRADGHTEWQPNPQSTQHFLFHVKAVDAYQSAMTQALKELVSSI